MSQSFDDAMRGTDGVFMACLVPRYHGAGDTPVTQMDDAKGWRKIVPATADDCLALIQVAARAGTQTWLTER